VAPRKGKKPRFKGVPIGLIPPGRMISWKNLNPSQMGKSHQDQEGKKKNIPSKKKGNFQSKEKSLGRGGSTSVHTWSELAVMENGD